MTRKQHNSIYEIVFFKYELPLTYIDYTGWASAKSSSGSATKS